MKTVLDLQHRSVTVSDCGEACEKTRATASYAYWRMWCSERCRDAHIWGKKCGDEKFVEVAHELSS
jgi:hypothetical protein